MKIPSPVRTAALAASALLVVGATLLDTRIEFLNGVESDVLIVALHRLALVTGPAAVLLFAFGVHWAATRRYRWASLAVPVLPVWSLLLVEMPTFTGTPMWMALFMAPYRGIQPFGVPPS